MRVTSVSLTRMPTEFIHISIWWVERVCIRLENTHENMDCELLVGKYRYGITEL